MIRWLSLLKCWYGMYGDCCTGFIGTGAGSGAGVTSGCCIGEVIRLNPV